MKHVTKAKKNDIVLHNGKEWKVMEREYDIYASQSFYWLRRSNGRGRLPDIKCVRSDRFTVV
jgi:hypothetical protein